MPTAAPESMLRVGSASSRQSRPHAAISAKAAVEQALHLKPPHEGWLALMDLVRKEYPYCTMYDVHICEGTIVSCENIQRSLVFGEDEAAPAAAPELFDRKWQALEAFCARMGTGRLVEIKFKDAKPMTARTAEGRRRFKRFQSKEDARR